MADHIVHLIGDAYQAECERFDAEMEQADGNAYACRYDLLWATRTSKMRALADRLFAAKEAAVGVRNQGFFMAGFAAGLKIAILAGLARQ